MRTAKNKMPSLFFVYMLKSVQTPNSSSTYVGFSTNPRRRLRQHNGEIKAGAKHTAKYRPWLHMAIVGGFPDKVVALMFEWQWQNPKRSRIVREYTRNACHGKGFKKQLDILHAMLQCPLWRQLDLVVNFVDRAAQDYFFGLQQRHAATNSSSGSSSIKSAVSGIRTAFLDASEVDTMHQEPRDRSVVGIAVSAASLLGDCVTCPLCGCDASESSKAMWCCPACSCSQHVICSAVFSARQPGGGKTPAQALPIAARSVLVAAASHLTVIQIAPPHFACHSCRQPCTRSVAAKMSFFPGALVGRMNGDGDTASDEEESDEDEDEEGGFGDAIDVFGEEEGTQGSQCPTQEDSESDNPF